MKNPEKMLKTGTRFEAKTKDGKEYTYRFEGFDIQELIHGTGCAYIVLYNETLGHETRVETNWFNEYLTDRKIEVLSSPVADGEEGCGEA